MLEHPDDIADLRRARALLESPGLAAKLSNLVGSPIEKGFAMLPATWHDTVNDVVRSAIGKSMDTALRTLDGGQGRTRNPANWLHKIAVGTTGAAGGAFGLAALAVELPVSTTIMLRSIADIARSEGEPLDSPEVRLECMHVLALGGRSAADDGAETGYFAARAALAKAVSEAVAHIASRGLSQQSAPALVRLVNQVAGRFSIVVSQKAAAQSMPVIGAIGGAVVNTLFIDHFQDMGRGHFIVRRLERAHGAEAVHQAYDRL